jgi:hypothetical protein
LLWHIGGGVCDVIVHAKQAWQGFSKAALPSEVPGAVLLVFHM